MSGGCLLREFRVERRAQIRRHRTRETWREIDDDNVYVLGVDGVENPPRSAHLLIQKIEHGRRRVAKAGEEVDLRAVRSRIDVPSARMLNHYLDNIRVLLRVFSI